MRPQTCRNKLLSLCPVQTAHVHNKRFLYAIMFWSHLLHSHHNNESMGYRHNLQQSCSPGLPAHHFTLRHQFSSPVLLKKFQCSRLQPMQPRSDRNPPPTPHPRTVVLPEAAPALGTLASINLNHRRLWSSLQGFSLRTFETAALIPRATH